MSNKNPKTRNRRSRKRENPSSEERNEVMGSPASENDDRDSNCDAGEQNVRLPSNALTPARKMDGTVVGIEPPRACNGGSVVGTAIRVKEEPMDVEHDTSTQHESIGRANFPSPERKLFVPLVKIKQEPLDPSCDLAVLESSKQSDTVENISPVRKKIKTESNGNNVAQTELQNEIVANQNGNCEAVIEKNALNCLATDSTSAKIAMNMQSINRDAQHEDSALGCTEVKHERAEPTSASTTRNQGETCGFVQIKNEPEDYSGESRGTKSPLNGQNLNAILKNIKLPRDGTILQSFPVSGTIHSETGETKSNNDCPKIPELKNSSMDDNSTSGEFEGTKSASSTECGAKDASSSSKPRMHSLPTVISVEAVKKRLSLAFDLSHVLEALEHAVERIGNMQNKIAQTPCFMKTNQNVSSRGTEIRLFISDIKSRTKSEGNKNLTGPDTHNIENEITSFISSMKSGKVENHSLNENRGVERSMIRAVTLNSSNHTCSDTTSKRNKPLCTPALEINPSAASENILPSTSFTGGFASSHDVSREDLSKIISSVSLYNKVPSLNLNSGGDNRILCSGQQCLEKDKVNALHFVRDHSINLARSSGVGGHADLNSEHNFASAPSMRTKLTNISVPPGPESSNKQNARLPVVTNSPERYAVPSPHVQNETLNQSLVTQSCFKNRSPSFNQASEYPRNQTLNREIDVSTNNHHHDAKSSRSQNSVYPPVTLNSIVINRQTTDATGSAHLHNVRNTPGSSESIKRNSTTVASFNSKSEGQRATCSGEKRKISHKDYLQRNSNKIPRTNNCERHEVAKYQNLPFITNLNQGIIVGDRSNINTSPRDPRLQRSVGCSPTSVSSMAPQTFVTSEYVARLPVSSETLADEMSAAASETAIPVVINRTSTPPIRISPRLSASSTTTSPYSSGNTVAVLPEEFHRNVAAHERPLRYSVSSSTVIAGNSIPVIDSSRRSMQQFQHPLRYPVSSSTAIAGNSIPVIDSSTRSMQEFQHSLHSASDSSVVQPSTFRVQLSPSSVQPSPSSIQPSTSGVQSSTSGAASSGSMTRTVTHETKELPDVNNELVNNETAYSSKATTSSDQATTSKEALTVHFPPFRGRVGSIEKWHDAIGKAVSCTQDVLNLILEWNFHWIDVQERTGECPPICMCFKEVKSTYKHFEDYYNTYLPLFMLSIWFEMCLSWKNNQFPFYAVHFETFFERSFNIKIICTTIMDSSEIKNFLKRDEIVCVKFFKDGKEDIIFGYISMVEEKDDPTRPKGKKVKVTFSSAENVGTGGDGMIQIKRLINGRMVLKQVEALRTLDISRFFHIILNPKEHASDINVVTLPSLSEVPEMFSTINNIASFTEVSGKITLVDNTLVCQDSLSSLSLLIQNLIERMSTVLVCLKDKRSLPAVSYKILNYLNPDKFILAVKSSEITLPDDLVEHSLQHILRNMDVDKKAKKECVKKDTDVILTSLDSMYLNKEHVSKFTKSDLTCVIDDASLCTETEMIIPLEYEIRHLVLLGNPTHEGREDLHPELQKYGFHHSLYHRLYKVKQA